MQRHGRGRVEGGGEGAGPDLIEQPRIKREISEGGGVGALRKTATGGGAGAKKKRNGPAEGERQRGNGEEHPRLRPIASADGGTGTDGRSQKYGLLARESRAQRLSREVSRAPARREFMPIGPQYFCGD